MMEFSRKKLILSLFFFCIAFSYISYIYVFQDVLFISKVAIVKSFLLAATLCILLFFLIRTVRYKTYSWKNIGKILLHALFVILIILVFLDIPYSYFLSPTIELSIILPPTDESKSVKIRGFHNGLAYQDISNEKVDLVENSSWLESDEIHMISTMGEGARVDWSGKSWEYLHFTFSDYCAGCQIDFNINHQESHFVFPQEKIYDFQVYVDNPAFSKVKVLSTVLVTINLFVLTFLINFYAFLTTGLATFFDLTKLLIKFFAQRAEDVSYLITNKKLRLSIIIFLITLIFLLLGAIFSRINFKYPTGFAGLYLLMTENLVNNKFSPPLSVPFYGGGNIPYAYPFFGFYFAGFFTKILGIAILDYARIAPFLFFILSMVVYFFILRTYLKSIIFSLIGTIIPISCPILFYGTVSSAGIVRGFALLLSLLSIFFYLQSIDRKSNRTVFLWLSIFTLGLTAMTHLSYAVFLTIYLSVSIFFEDQNIFNKIKKLFFLGIGSILVSSPWWYFVLKNYGFTTFLNALSTHGNYGFFAHLFSQPRMIFTDYYPIQFQIGNKGIIPILQCAMMFLAIIRITPPLLGWFIASIVMGESAPFTGLLSGLFITQAFLIVISRFKKKAFKIVTLFILLMLVILFAFFLIADIWDYQPALSEDFVTMGKWIKDNIPSSEKYFFIDKSHELNEWLPFFSHKTAAISPWGAEWTGDYEMQNSNRRELNDCITDHNIVCVEDKRKSICEDSLCDLIIVNKAYTEINDYYEENGDLFSIIYENSIYRIYEQLN